jgi:hypothetical protein
VIGARKPRKLTKPLKSTLKGIRERFKKVFKKTLPQSVIYEVALSEDKYIENWKAGLLLVVDEPSQAKAESEAKKMLQALEGTDQPKKRAAKRRPA